MQINFTCIGGGPLITTQKLRFTAAEEESPLAIVTSVINDPPHNFPLNVSLNVPNPVAHRVNIYSTPDGISGTLVASFVYDPTYTNVQVRLRMELNPGGGVVDGVPYPAFDGTNSIPVIDSLRGWDWYPVVRSVGELSETEYTQTESLGAGTGFDSFTMDLPDFLFTDTGEFVFIHFYPKISASAPVFTYINLYTDILVPEWDGLWKATLDASWYRKVVELITPGPAPTVNLLPLVNVPNNTLLTFSTVMGSQKGAIITASAGEGIITMRQSFASIYLGENEVVQIMRRADGWHVVNDWQGMVRAGTCFEDYAINRPNQIIHNGFGLIVAGVPTAIDITVHPRVGWFVTNQLQAGQLVTKAARDADPNNLGSFYAIDGNLVYAPDCRGLSSRMIPGTRGNDAGRTAASIPGSFEMDSLVFHRHFTIVDRQINSSNFPNPVSLIKALIKHWNKTSSSGKESYYAVGGNDNEEPTLSPTNLAGNATETRGKNYGVLKCSWA